MHLETDLSKFSVFALGVGGSLAASIGTGVGALPVFAFGQVSQRTRDILQSIAAGIMLAAIFMSLVIPGVEAGAKQHSSKLVGALIVGAAICVGAIVVLGIHRHAPHEHFLTGREGPLSSHLRRTWLFVIAITLHNFPEGMAVGVGFGDGNIANGVAMSTAIFVQNLPEGFVVALGLLAAGYRRPFAVFAACATGLVETLGGLIGAAAVSSVVTILPWAMGFAAGAMLFVVSHEIIPETHRNGFETEATFGLVGGFVTMLVLEGALA